MIVPKASNVAKHLAILAANTTPHLVLFLPSIIRLSAPFTSFGCSGEPRGNLKPSTYRCVVQSEEEMGGASKEDGGAQMQTLVPRPCDPDLGSHHVLGLGPAKQKVQIQTAGTYPWVKG